MEKQWNNEEISGSVKITRNELIAMGIPEIDIDDGESRGILKAIGPWQIPVSYKAMAVSGTWKDIGYGLTRMVKLIAYGIRTMNKIHQSGYEIEGWVSINGKKYSCFSSSQLFELEDGKLINVATIHARMD